MKLCKDEATGNRQAAIASPRAIDGKDKDRWKEGINNETDSLMKDKVYVKDNEEAVMSRPDVYDKEKRWLLGRKLNGLKQSPEVLNEMIMEELASSGSHNDECCGLIGACAGERNAT